jgi:hypothetical protein
VDGWVGGCSATQHHHPLIACTQPIPPLSSTYILAGGYALLRTVLYATCESDPLAETGKLMKKFGLQEAKQGIKVDR